VWLGATLQATSTLPVGTAVTPPGARYHPIQIAHVWATMESMLPGQRTRVTGRVGTVEASA
jgi:alkanesulfonate monooxygenase SsuD/methylene tetrahydromethanopterin reductase-like flavin-dependent oxidoreductase (luciferase family)